MKTKKLLPPQKILLSFFLILLGLFGCNDEKIQIEEAEDVYLKEGILHFKSISAFEKTLNDLSKFDSVQFSVWKNNFSGFTSLNDRYVEILNSDKYENVDKSLEEIATEEDLPYIPGFSFPSIISQNGLYSLDNKIHRFSTENRFEYIYDYDEELLHNWEKMLTIPADKYKKFEIQDVLAKSEQANSRINWWYGNAFESIYPYWDLGEQHLACDIRAWAVNYSNYAYIGASIDGRKYKKSCGLCQWKWQGDDMWYASISTTTIPYRANDTDHAVSPKFDYVNHESYVNVEVFIMNGPYVWNAPIQGVELEITYTYEDDGYPRKTYYREHK